ncbi:MAG: CotH kinase family protein [Pirellulales bacterium]
MISPFNGRTDARLLESRSIGASAKRLAVTLAGLAIVAAMGCNQSESPRPASLRAPLQTVAAQKAAAPQPAVPQLRRDSSDEFFRKGVIPQLKIQISNEQAQFLRQDARRYVEATLVENGDKTYRKVSVKLKGAAGSFRGFDDRPALTIKMDRFKKDQTFHDLEKFHLNNSVQDESLLSELVCAEICREAGLPAARVTHARVWINDRDLGVYVLKEGFDKRFLERHFLDASGNLYDGGFLRDIDQDLEKDGGDGVDDFTDLKQLVAACREGDPAKRWEKVAEKLDVDKFLTFMAIERMTCHWDGYVNNRNNYRVYFDPRTGRAHFFPHGMDQMFSDPGFAVYDGWAAIVPQTVMQNPVWQRAYRKRVDQLMPLFAPEKLHPVVDAAVERLRPVLTQISPDRARHQEDRAKEMKGRLAERPKRMLEQRAQRPPEPLEFDAQGRVELADWQPMKETDDARIEAETKGNRQELVIQAGASGRCVASWRKKVLLAQGKYRLEAKVATRGVDAPPEEQGTGAGLRMSGGRRDNRLVGDAPWTDLAFEFEIGEAMREVVLVAELRCRVGEARFQSPLILRQIPVAR